MSVVSKELASIDSFSSSVGGNATSCLLAKVGILKTRCAAPSCRQACAGLIKNKRQCNLAMAVSKDVIRTKNGQMGLWMGFMRAVSSVM